MASLRSFDRQDPRRTLWLDTDHSHTRAGPGSPNTTHHHELSRGSRVWTGHCERPAHYGSDAFRARHKRDGRALTRLVLPLRQHDHTAYPVSDHKIDRRRSRTREGNGPQPNLSPPHIPATQREQGHQAARHLAPSRITARSQSDPSSIALNGPPGRRRRRACSSSASQRARGLLLATRSRWRDAERLQKSGEVAADVPVRGVRAPVGTHRDALRVVLDYRDHHRVSAGAALAVGPALSRARYVVGVQGILCASSPTRCQEGRRSRLSIRRWQGGVAYRDLHAPKVLPTAHSSSSHSSPSATPPTQQSRCDPLFSSPAFGRARREAFMPYISRVDARQRSDPRLNHGQQLGTFGSTNGVPCRLPDVCPLL